MSLLFNVKVAWFVDGQRINTTSISAAPNLNYLHYMIDKIQDSGHVNDLPTKLNDEWPKYTNINVGL